MFEPPQGLRGQRQGAAPYRVVVVHGGPGAAGSLTPMAVELSKKCGVLEPWQTARSVAGQVAELARWIKDETDTPAVLVGHSWGAWLAGLTAAEYPQDVSKVILVGSGPFRAEDACGIAETRLARLNSAQRDEYAALLTGLQTADRMTPQAGRRLRQLMDITDQFDLLPAFAREFTLPDSEIFQQVWPEADALRRSGALLAAFSRLNCQVVALHGAYDPHPAAAVSDALRENIEQFRMDILPDCGHEPWAERRARARFFEILDAELADAVGV